jgi:flagellar motor protein MotB
MTIRLGLMALCAAAFVALGTGCTNTKQAAERDSLLDQNKKLQEQLQAEQAARISAESRANAATSQVTAEPTTPTMASAEGTGGALDMSSTGGSGAKNSRNTRSAAGLPNAGEGISSSFNSAGEIVLEISGDVLFDSGKATLKPSASKSLDAIAATIKSKYGGEMIRVEGHTDATPVKTSGWDNNYDLGAARATTVLLYLSKKGVPEKSMYIASYGANDPKSAKNQALNRRVDIVVVKNAK